MSRKRLLLVGWDSADWKVMHPLMDAGKLPVVAHLVNRGTSGNLTTLEPQLSPMLWTSIATGKMAYHHGVAGFTEVDPDTGAVVPVSAATRRCRTLWEMLGEHGLRSHLVNWFATQGEQHLDGRMVSNMFCHLQGVRPGQDPATWPPPPPGTYWPPELAATMNELRVSPYEVDPDQILRLFVPDAPKVDQTKDPRLLHLARLLAESFSVHSAATHLMESDPDWDFMAVYYRSIDEISHAFMPYHPPKIEGIPQEDFEMYREVVNGSYRLHDLLLQRLVQLAGPDAAIVLVSDHGFHSDHLRPKFTPRVPAGITVWHRPQGVMVASGPGFKPDSLVHGARLLDVAPTILHYFGLPVGRDMEGRVLGEAFAESTPVAFIPTWEQPDIAKPARCRMEDADRKALLDQFVALGYIDDVSVDPGEATADTERENQWNMALACIHGARHEMALPLLEACFHARPERTDYAQVLANCQLQLGLLDEADATAALALKTFGRTEPAHLLKASIAIQKEDFHGALRWLEIVRKTEPEELQLQLMLAKSYLHLRRWEDAEIAARKVLAADPHHPTALLILARLQLHRQDAEAAVNSALEALGFQYGNPEAHFLLGAALAQLENWSEAEHALLNCLQLNPDSIRSYRLLARVYRALGEDGKAVACEVQARATLARLKEQRTARLGTLREDAARRADARAIGDRQKQLEADRRAAEEAAVEPMDFIIVSGLPRSGTSLMMQIVQAGGLPLMTDGRRGADLDNPEGYWEWEDIKKLGKNPRIIEQAQGKVVKVISALLPGLPRKHRYKIIYMTRPVEQVVASQWAMLEHTGQKPKSEKNHLIEVQRQHSENILQILKRSEQCEVLEISYPDLVADPEPAIQAIADFLPGVFSAGPAVRAAVKPALFRNRQAPEKSPAKACGQLAQ
jgi:tetratricopeptide (TPR) repeat protein